jgi:two-component system response regulator YesN
MLTVLIADDERWVREGIRQKVDWQDKYICCGMAGDGTEAYRLCMNLRPDIIITDVRMPGMDGLTVIKKLKELLPHTAVIIVSGYHEFDYVKAAMDLGAVAYALKPVEREEINLALNKARQQINSRKASGARTPLPFLAGKLLNDLYRALPVDEAHFLGILQKMGMNQRHWACMMVQIVQYSTDYESVRRHLAESLASGEDSTPSLMFEPENMLFGVLVAGHEAPDTRAMARGLIHSLQERGQIDSSISLGITAGSAREIPRSVESARLGLQLIHPYAAGELIMPEQARAARGTALPTELLDGLVRAIYAADRPRLSSALEEVDEHFAGRDMVLGGMKNSLAIIMGDILRIAYQGGVPAGTLDEGIGLLQQINQMNRWSGVRGAFEDFCLKVMLGLNGGTENIMDSAERYIKTHYHEGISLRKLAESFYLSPSYFSYAFKQYTGKTPSDYLVTVRMERAKELLAQGELKITKIAQMVGYEDNSYFGKQFRKYTGLMPSAYQAAAREVPE